MAVTVHERAEHVPAVRYRIGTADVQGRPRGVETRLRALLAALPEAAVIATLRPVWSTRTSAALNAVARSGAVAQPDDLGHAWRAGAVLAAG